MVNIEELLQYNDSNVADAYEHLRFCTKTECKTCVSIHNYLDAYQKMSDDIKNLVNEIVFVQDKKS